MQHLENLIAKCNSEAADVGNNEVSLSSCSIGKGADYLENSNKRVTKN